MNNTENRFYAVDVRKLVTGIVYLLLIGVVIYGMGDHVYDGFGKGVPWVIMILFFAMGVMRIFEAVTGKNVYEWLHDQNLFGDDDKESAPKSRE